MFECENEGLSAQRDELYLFDASGTLCDWAFLRDIPAGGSYGRLNGENGYFYFAQSSRGADNGTDTAWWRQSPRSISPRACTTTPRALR